MAETNEPLDPWAPGGTKTEPTAPKKNEGWLLEEKPPFENFNWFWAEMVDRFNFLYANTTQPWRNDIDYAGSSQTVKGSNGVIYVSLQTSGPGSVVQDPTTDGSNTYWEPLSDWLNLGSMASKTAGTGGAEFRTNTQNNGTFLTEGTSGTQGRNNTQNDARFVSQASREPQTVWTGTQATVTAADVLADTGFVMVGGTYILYNQNDTTAVIIQDDFNVRSQGYSLFNNAGRELFFIEWDSSTFTQYRINEAFIRTAGFNFDRIDYIPF